MIDDHPMLAKVRKLLAKAENDATTEAEAELYTAKAAQLIADYGIDQALLGADGPDRGAVGDRVVRLDAPYARDKADLLSTVATSLRCRCVRIVEPGEAGKAFAVHLFGHRADLERAELMFTSLLLQAATWMVRTPIPPREHKAAFRRSWLAGFRSAIGRRLSDAEHRAEQHANTRRTTSGQSATLVLADRAAAVDQTMQAAYPRLRPARARSYSGSGLPQGWAAGQRADLGGTRVDAASRAMLR